MNFSELGKCSPRNSVCDSIFCDISPLMIAVGRDSPSILKPSSDSVTVPMCRLRISAPVVAAPVVFSITNACRKSLPNIPQNFIILLSAAFSATFSAALNAFLPPALSIAPLTVLVAALSITVVAPLANSPPAKNCTVKGTDCKLPLNILYDDGITAFSTASASLACANNLRLIKSSCVMFSPFCIFFARGYIIIASFRSVTPKSHAPIPVIPDVWTACPHSFLRLFLPSSSSMTALY